MLGTSKALGNIRIKSRQMDLEEDNFWRELGKMESSLPPSKYAIFVTFYKRVTRHVKENLQTRLIR